MNIRWLVFVGAAIATASGACAPPANGDGGTDGGPSDAVDESELGSDGADDASPGDAAADTGSTSCDGIERDFWTWDLAVMPPPAYRTLDLRLRSISRRTGRPALRGTCSFVARLRTEAFRIHPRSRRS